MMHCNIWSVLARWLAVVTIAASCSTAVADDDRFAHATEIITTFAADEEHGIPVDLLARAHGIAVIPRVVRGGLLIGARRGRGVLTLRGPDNRFTNPALITLTGGSIGGQIGVSSTDVVLVFANERAVRNIESGRFTLGGDVTTVAGPAGRNTAVALTGNAEVYMYTRSRGLFAGAALEGARLNVDDDATAVFYYSRNSTERAFTPPSAATPAPARQFLSALERAATLSRPSVTSPARGPDEEARTFPLER